jgi:isopenicillin N synthase-like dioxygenase
MSPLSVDRAPSRDRSAYLAMIPQLEQHGFLRLPADTALRQAVDRAFTLASEFFARPAEQKFRYTTPNGSRAIAS